MAAAAAALSGARTACVSRLRSCARSLPGKLETSRTRCEGSRTGAEAPPPMPPPRAVTLQPQPPTARGVRPVGFPSTTNSRCRSNLSTSASDVTFAATSDVTSAATSSPATLCFAKCSSARSSATTSQDAATPCSAAAYLAKASLHSSAMPMTMTCDSTCNTSNSDFPFPRDSATAAEHRCSRVDVWLVFSCMQCVESCCDADSSSPASLTCCSSFS
mmetsp:Transcript_133773/g.266913  ORF Transcript_133773/g.266913 Transcript_133773/m.266913 type:complete len:217 (-) Transcript_133773:375-1025(-)